ncbi:unnamed protein product [Medioppia subpectinata]|uniref:Uncharacterized protein n=1 Tax=Medioppia subpectinata TaxID=1979941 RepID=A0A7R9LU48_9ACAR|nr:unnamed protein product [Medioppia subpectinata]CAG2121177.1 unnamed protein product [Medioppia subpectinata]
MTINNETIANDLQQIDLYERDICENITHVDCIELQKVYTEYQSALEAGDYVCKTLLQDPDHRDPELLAIKSMKLEKLRETEANLRPLIEKHPALRVVLLDDFLINVRHAKAVVFNKEILFPTTTAKP